LFFGALAALPDLDVVPVALGVADAGAFGHRGASHSFAVALAVGIVAGLLGRRWGWSGMRTLVFATVAVGSHACLDVLDGGRGLLLFWPLSHELCASSRQVLREAPRGLALFCRAGVLNVLHEVAFFSPLVVAALWPQRGREPPARQPPHLTLLPSGSALTAQQRPTEPIDPARPVAPANPSDSTAQTTDARSAG